MKASAVHNRTAILIASFLFLFLGVCGLFLSFLLPITSISTDYGMMVDAGSSKSELRIYEWPHQQTSSIPSLKETPVSPGNEDRNEVKAISSFVNDLDGLRDAMEDLIEYAKDEIDEDLYSYTPLFLKATAGMRLLPVDQQESILAVIREVFSASPFRFEDSWATVISGQDEGVFGWLTVNFLTGKLSEGNPPETYGALDLGGASTQITFVPSSSPTSDNYTLRLDKETYELFSKSYISYGSDQARFNFNVSLIPLNPSSNLLNPCLNTGFNLDSSTFQSGGVTYFLEGTSNYSNCEQLIVQNLFDPAVFPPPTSDLRGLFYAFAGFVYTPEFFDLPPDASINMLREEGKKFCNLTWDEVIQKHPSDAPIFLANYCFNSAYIAAMLDEAYGFDPNARGILTFMGSISGVNLDWTLGAMLYEVTNLEDIPPPTVPLFKDFIGIITICISIFFILLGIIMFAFYRSVRSFPEEQQSLLVNVYP